MKVDKQMVLELAHQIVADYDPPTMEHCSDMIQSFYDCGEDPPCSDIQLWDAVQKGEEGV
tara:strand:+ start:411 stop:590 length:180 start_codon:yes stop_codon:yes gene_type:complete